MSQPKPYWNPYLAGIGIGLVALTSFVLTGHGIGASGAFKQIQATVIHAADPTWAEENENIAASFQPGQSPLNQWIVFLAAGIAGGGLLGALTARRFKRETIHGPRISKQNRWVIALLGGMISGLAAQIARGCTSGQAITGGAQLALGSWVFMFSVFGGAYGLAYFVRKQWI